MKTTYHGSCHCQAVRFEADIDLDQGTGKCNCSICTKVRNWSVMAKPEDFRLQSGQAQLGDYSFGTGQAHHYFCRRCGVRTHTQGYIEQVGGAFVSVQLSALDDVPLEALLAAEVRYANGRDNVWWETPAETRHL